MAETKYGKYIVTEPKFPKGVTPPSIPPEKRTGEVILVSDNEVIEGAFYLNCALIWKASDRGSPGGSHTHDWDEYIGFIGSNPEDPHNLFGEVEITLGDEIHTLIKSCAVFVPKGLSHCPVVFKRVDRPIFYFSTGPRSVYDKEQHTE